MAANSFIELKLKLSLIILWLIICLTGAGDRCFNTATELLEEKLSSQDIAQGYSDIFTDSHHPYILGTFSYARLKPHGSAVHVQYSATAYLKTKPKLQAKIKGNSKPNVVNSKAKKIGTKPNYFCLILNSISWAFLGKTIVSPILLDC